MSRLPSKTSFVVAFLIKSISKIDPEKSTRTTLRSNRNRARMIKTRAESDSSSKIMRYRKPVLIQTVHLIPRTWGQRGLRHAEWRTPRFCPKEVQEKNRKENVSHHIMDRYFFSKNVMCWEHVWNWYPRNYWKLKNNHQIIKPQYICQCLNTLGFDLGPRNHRNTEGEKSIFFMKNHIFGQNFVSSQRISMKLPGIVDHVHI